MAMLGNTLRLHVDTNPGGTPTFVTLDCETESSYDISQNTVDNDCKDGSDWMSHEKTKRQATFSVSGNYNEGQTGVLRLLTNIKAGNTTLFEWKIFDGYKETGEGTIESFNMTSPVSNFVTFSATIKVNGEVLTEAA